MVHGAIPFYQVGEMRIRSEQVVQKSGISKTAEDLIRVVAVDQPVQAASESQVIDKLHSPRGQGRSGTLPSSRSGGMRTEAWLCS